MYFQFSMLSMKAWICWRTIRGTCMKVKGQRLIESITTLRKGQVNPIRVSMICNPWRGLPSRGCRKSWTRGWNSLVPSCVVIDYFSPTALFSINNPILMSFTLFKAQRFGAAACGNITPIATLWRHRCSLSPPPEDWFVISQLFSGQFCPRWEKTLSFHPKTPKSIIFIWSHLSHKLIT